MTFACRFCGFRVFWNTDIKNPSTGKPTLCNAKNGDGDYDVIHRCSVKNVIDKRMTEEEKAIKNFTASVKEGTRKAILD